MSFDLAPLRTRVEAYVFDRPGEAIPFSSRLRRETGWSARKAARAICEYRRFVILAIAAGHRVSPSAAVDRVWHLHLTETRRYWDEFCPHVLGGPLHHEPGRGGPEETRELADTYRATLQSYQRIFGEPAPADLWPRHDGSLPAQAAVALRQAHEALRRLRAAPLAALGLGGCAAIYDSAAPGALQGPAFLCVFVLASAVALWLTSAAQKAARSLRADPSTREGDLDTYEIAYLAGGETRVVEAGLLRLMQGGHIVLHPAQRRPVRTAPPAEDAPAIERALAGAIADRAFSGPRSIGRSIEAVRARLEAAGLVPNERARRTALWIALAFVGPVELLGFVRLYFGFANHRPIGFLVAGVFLLPALAVTISKAGFAVTDAGRRVRKAARMALSRRECRELDDPRLARVTAIYGLAALSVVGLADLRRYTASFAPAGSDGGGAGCGGGGCGGGGCGG